MNENTLKGEWTQIKGKIREQWGKLTDDDLDVIAGKRDQLAGVLQKRYGSAQDEIDRQIREFEDRHASV
jgi:uncharacterized protein YjbJ (UPF0337 family)